MREQRFAKAEFAAWVGIFTNLSLAILKGAVGFLSKSQALIADAANSASDVASSIAVLVGFRAAKLPPDRDHPYGHGKAESVAAIIVSVLVLLVGFEISRNAVVTLFSGGTLEAPESFAVWALIISIVVKELLFIYNIRLGRELRSQVLTATAWDHRSDVWASAAALIGVLAALAGEWLNQPLLFYADPIAGLLVACLVLRMGYRLIRDSIHTTLDHVLHAEDAEDLVHAAQNVKGVITVDDLRAREHGHYVVVDAKISVNPNITVLEGHDIAKAVKQELMSKFSHVSDVFVHVNPYDPGFPYNGMAESPPDGRSTLLH